MNCSDAVPTLSDEMNYQTRIPQSGEQAELLKDKLTPKAIVADAEQLLILTGNGDVLEPEGGIAAIGSGGNYALSAAKALADYEQDPEVLARRAMQIASEVCVFTNDRLTVETIEG